MFLNDFYLEEPCLFIYIYIHVFLMLFKFFRKRFRMLQVWKVLQAQKVTHYASEVRVRKRADISVSRLYFQIEVEGKSSVPYALHACRRTAYSSTVFFTKVSFRFLVNTSMPVYVSMSVLSTIQSSLNK